MITLKTYTIDNWKVMEQQGKIGTFSATITEEMHSQFNKICCNISPLHVDDEHAKNLGFRKKVTIGLLSELYLIPFIQENILGKNAVGCAWNIEFNKSLYVGDTLTFVIELTKVRRSIKTSVTKATVTNQNGELTARILITNKLLV